MGARIGLFTAAAMAVALGACGQPQQAAPSVETAGEAAAVSPLSAAALDPCAGQLKAICADKDLAALSGQMKDALTDAAKDVSAEGAQIIAANQQSWLETQRVSCGVEAGATSIAPAQEACLKAALSDRVREAGAVVEKRGPFTFQKVEVNRASAVATIEAVGDEPVTSVDIDYPRIDGDTPAIRKFNEAVKQVPRFKATDGTEEATKYQIGYAGDDLVSVRFDLYDFTSGAAHPNNSMRAVTINMTTGAPVTAADMFTGKWQDFLAARAARDITVKLREEDDSARPVEAADVRKAIASPDAWLVTDNALVLLLPAVSFGQPMAGPQEVTIPWRELKPYLNPRGPGPLKGA